VIPPEEFATEFRTLMAAHQVQLDFLCGRKQEYTAHVIDIVLPAIASSLNYICRPQHRTLDAVFFPVDAASRHLFHVAIEHENVGRCAAEELVKLCLFNVPLKVLISYTYHEDSNLQRFLSHLAAQMVAMDYFHDFADRG
jgi:hypothetical protein